MRPLEPGLSSRHCSRPSGRQYPIANFDDDVEMTQWIYGDSSIGGCRAALRMPFHASLGGESHVSRSTGKP